MYGGLAVNIQTDRAAIAATGAHAPTYRPDIDGLRALAVLPVIAFHMGVQALDGGFIGVDIFFVISGYLISSRILADTAAGRFSLTDFYVRRIRRIFPAFAAMMIATTIGAIIIEFPGDLARYGNSLIAATLSFSNVHFWWTTDYFVPQAQSAALLHTWSLSVEEQFYLVFPPLVMLLTKWRNRLDLVLWLILAMSLAASAVTAFTDPVSAFYLPHFRIWEFLIGTMIVRRPNGLFTRDMVREGAAGVGLALIVGSILLLNHKMPFPGLYAVPGCLGTALIIAAGEQGRTLVYRLLAWAPLRGVGLISYSLYLWHWPVIVLFKTWKPTQFLSMTDKAILAVVIVVLAIASWRFIEQPFRQARHARGQVFGAFGVACAVIVGLGAVTAATGGFPQRFTTEQRRLAGYLDDRPRNRDAVCFAGLRDTITDYDATKCLTPVPGKANVLLLGDSHANHLWYGLSRHAQANVMELASHGCLPLLTSLHSDDLLCRATTAYALRAIPGLHADLIILSANWDSGDGKNVQAMLDWLAQHGQRVVLSGPIVEYDAELPKLLVLSDVRRKPALWEKFLKSGRREIDADFAAIAARNHVAYLSPLKALCSDYPHCTVLTPQRAAVQMDYGHLTPEGSDYVVAQMLNGRSIMDVARRN